MDVTITNEDVVEIVNRSRDNAHQMRVRRASENAANWRVVNGDLDFSGKIEGQSTLVLPDLARGLEQAGATLERELTNNTDWFSLDDFDDIPEEVLDPDSMKKLTQFMLRNLHAPGYYIAGARTFEGVIADGLKIGMVEGEIVLKVAPMTSTRKIVRSVEVAPSADDMPEIPVEAYNFKQRELKVTEVKTLRLDVRVVPFEDFYPDPSGCNAWVIHESTQKVSSLEQNPDYDKEALQRLRSRVAERDEVSLKMARENQTMPPETIGTVRVREFWGDLANKEGEVLARNMLCSVAENEVLRKPIENPLAHKSFPFVRGQLRRAPLAEVHPAFIDLAIDPYLAENELFNLLLDHSKQSVHGNYQTRPDMLENEGDIAKGIKTGARFRLKRNAGAGQFMERVDDPKVPQHAEMMLGKLGQRREVALATPDLQLGSQQREQLATEIITTQEGTGSFFETISNRLEDSVIEPALKLSALTILQYLDDFSDPDIIRLLGPDRALMLKQLDASERFELLSGAVNFKATGLREMVGRVRELRKWITAMNMITNNPTLAQVYDQNYSYKRTLNFIMRSLGVDVSVLEKRPGEAPELDPQLLAAQAGMGGTGGSPPSPDQAAMEQSMNPGNAQGERGAQFP
jgi:hypothetical protein